MHHCMASFISVNQFKWASCPCTPESFSCTPDPYISKKHGFRTDTKKSPSLSRHAFCVGI